MLFGDRFANGQAQPQATELACDRLTTLLESIKDHMQIIRFDTNTRVTDCQAQSIGLGFELINRIDPPSGVNLTALFSKFHNTC